MTLTLQIKLNDKFADEFHYCFSHKLGNLVIVHTLKDHDDFVPDKSRTLCFKAVVKIPVDESEKLRHW